MRRYFGRRLARGLTKRQEDCLQGLLPQIRVDLATPVPARINELFPLAAQDVWLEIGFGAGEHLIAQAKARPETGFIGAEPFVKGVARLLTQIDDASLRNILIYGDDARDLLAWLAPACLGRVFLLFPDPWPKRRHLERRFLSEDTLGNLARVMRPGAELRFASDSGHYIQSARQVASHPAFRMAAEWPNAHERRPEGWPETRYERKAHAAGRRCAYMSFIRR